MKTSSAIFVISGALGGVTTLAGLSWWHYNRKLKACEAVKQDALENLFELPCLGLDIWEGLSKNVFKVGLGVTVLIAGTGAVVKVRGK